MEPGIEKARRVWKGTGYERKDRERRRDRDCIYRRPGIELGVGKEKKEETEKHKKEGCWNETKGNRGREKRRHREE